MDFLTQLKPRVKQIVAAFLIIGLILLAGIIGYLFPHSPTVIYKTKTVTVTKTNEIQNCPNGPVILQTVGHWNFITDKTSGCVWVESESDDGKSIKLLNMVKPSAVCIR